ncbi:HIT domain-containing protein [Dyella sp. BiH032]|uniref:HIT family protein n=1 Tax=Dyella sp. BiH032 TaxID=3075430 RepID=UPI002892B775|nr:HIT domain-containing protein [Dyella sp. BiH032]WNL45827.1 HIT domain-containing protein [Dyella sp. BiH032]
MTCPFCAIVAGQAEASIVAETPAAIAFLDLRQAVPGHVLVVPRRHVETIFELDPALGGELMVLATGVAKALQASLQPAGLNLWQSNGAAGGQEVPHLHLHVQPRRVGDGLFRVYPQGLPAPARRDALEQLAARIRPHLPLSGPAPHRI